MKIFYLESVDSTQIYLKKLLHDKTLQPPLAVCAKIQTQGVGSRDNTWIGLEGNLFVSFALSLKDLPEDLKLESSSLYFSQILKETLENLGSKVWLKWPNDFYLGENKIGGMITNISRSSLICGIGLNLVASPENFSKIDIELDIRNLLKLYFENIEKKSSWKQVFSKYQLEFYKNQNFFTHNNNLKISLGNAILQCDGSIISNGERIYSLR
ncbi:MAG: biotin--[acetyl-CoA-carboxylase] ligase [Sulfurimonas sp.]|nr:biotin--[acetyl-CoA-carboxylase] ligase [Sulfurimonas sp.]